MKDEIIQEEDLYTIVNNDLLKDEKMSMQAKGLYAYLRSNKSTFKIYKGEVYKHFSNGRDAVNSAWKELIDSGWIVSKPLIENGKANGWEHSVRRALPTHWNPVRRESRQTENPSLINNNNNKYQNNKLKRSVSYETEFDDFWSTIRAVYKKHGFTSIGNKEPARKAFKKALKLTDLNNLKTQFCNHIERKSLIRSKGHFTPIPRHASTWLNNRGWTEEVECMPNVSKASHRATGAVSRHVMEEFEGNEAWGVKDDGSF